jgi:predicted Zn-dependent peptidase
MKKITLSICAVTLLAATSIGQTLDRSIRPKAGPAPEIKLGKTESITLPNGLKVFVVENHKLPALTVSIQLDIKPELEGNMAGYQDIAGELMSSGTKTRTKDQLNAAIDAVGASINASKDVIYGNSLKKHQNTLLELMSDMVINSDFKQAELNKIKTQVLSGLEAAKNEPDAMLNNVTQMVNFGPNHPYGQIATEETVKSITLEKTKQYYQTYFRPNVAYMAIVGDVTMAEIKPLIEKYFGKWQKGNVPVATYATVQKASGSRVALASRDAAVQSVFNVTYPIDLKPGEPDVIKAKVANNILGGGSQGRLFLNLRETHGWTYGSYSTISEDDLAGSFTGYAKCRNVVTDSSIAEVIREMKRLQTETVSEEELRNRITFMTGNFAMGLESPQTVAQYAINIERYKMPKDYYTNYLKNLSAVTAGDVQAMAKKYITPENANIVVVGSEEMAPKLAQFGKVELYDNYGRPAEKKTAAAAPAGVTAKEVMGKYVAAIGGEKAISNIKDIKVVGTVEMQGMKLAFTEVKKTGGMVKKTVDIGGNVIQKMVFDGKKGYNEVQGQKKNLEGEMLAGIQEKSDLQADLHPEKYNKEMTLKGVEKVGDVNAYVIELTGMDGKKSKAYYDVTTGYLVKQIATNKTPEGEASSVFEFSDYREVPGTNGYKMPYSVKLTGVAPMPIATTISTVEVNKGIADSEFQ